MIGLSLFSGVGGFELAAEIAGLDVEWRYQVEIDEACRLVLERHYPHTDRSIVDVTKARAEDFGHVDIIVGGFPCQDLSVAGRGAGLAGERSGLWDDYARLVRDLRPRYVVVENVAALLVRGFGRVAGDLAAGGYDLEWACVSAAACGAPHIRDRLWILAHANGGRLEDERGPSDDGREDGEHASRLVADGCVREGAHASDADDGNGDAGAGTVGKESWRGQSRDRRPLAVGGYWLSTPSPEPALCRMDDGSPSRVDRLAQRRRERERLKQLGNGIVPQCAAVALRRVKELELMVKQ